MISCSFKANQMSASAALEIAGEIFAHVHSAYKIIGYRWQNLYKKTYFNLVLWKLLFGNGVVIRKA